MINYSFYFFVSSILLYKNQPATGGIFKLYSAGTNLDLGKSKVLEYHGNNVVFETFLYPFIEQSTLSKIKSNSSFSEIEVAVSINEVVKQQLKRDIDYYYSAY
jgi:hypothetical protein